MAKIQEAVEQTIGAFRGETRHFDKRDAAEVSVALAAGAGIAIAANSLRKEEARRAFGETISTAKTATLERIATVRSSVTDKISELRGITPDKQEIVIPQNMGEVVNPNSMPGEAIDTTHLAAGSPSGHEIHG